MAAYMRERRANRRRKLIEIKGSRCLECGGVESLEFNHRDRDEKSFNLSGKWLDTKWEVILKELDKCDLLCKKCHLTYTRKQYEEKEITVWNSRKDVPYKHGTTRTYTEIKCRCVDCKYARSLHRKKLISYSDEVKYNESA